jgi:hypothetical protein
MWLYRTRGDTCPHAIILQVMALPALFLGIWFLIQLFQGTMASGATGVAGGHIGGFVLGFIVAAFMGGHRLRPAGLQTRPNSDPSPTSASNSSAEILTDSRRCSTRLGGRGGFAQSSGGTP